MKLMHYLIARQNFPVLRCPTRCSPPSTEICIVCKQNGRAPEICGSRQREWVLPALHCMQTLPAQTPELSIRASSYLLQHLTWCAVDIEHFMSMPHKPPKYHMRNVKKHTADWQGRCTAHYHCSSSCLQTEVTPLLLIRQGRLNNTHHARNALPNLVYNNSSTMHLPCSSQRSDTAAAGNGHAMPLATVALICWTNMGLK